MVLKFLVRSIFLPFLDPVKMFDYLAIAGVPDVEHLLPGLHSLADIQYLKRKLRNWNVNLDIDAKLQDMSVIMNGRPSAIETIETISNDEYNSVESDEIIKNKLSNFPKFDLPAIKEDVTLSPIITPPIELMETTTRSGYWPGPRKLTNCKSLFNPKPKNVFSF